MKNNKGFSLTELLYSLIIVGAITVIGVIIVQGQINQEKINSVVDAVEIQENSIIKYLNNSQEAQIKTLKTRKRPAILPASSYASTTALNLSFYKRAFDPPCLIMYLDTQNKLNASLLYPNNGKRDSFFTKSNIGKIAKQKDLEIVDSSYKLIADNLPTIQTNCGIVVRGYSLLDNLNKNPKFIVKKNFVTDSSITDKSTNETLKNVTDGVDSNTTMNTNLYFDVVTKEQESFASRICDSSKLVQSEADSNCQNSATGNKIYAGSAQWDNGFNEVGGRCQYSSSALFQYNTYSCNSSNWSSTANNQCTSTQNTVYSRYGLKWYGGYSWDNVNLNGTSCSARLGCVYDTNVCNVNLQPVYDDICRDATTGKPNCTCDGLNDPTHVSIKYNSSTNKCELYTSGWGCQGRPLSGSAIVNPNPYNAGSLSAYYTSFNNLSASSTPTSPAREQCNVVIKDKWNISGINPAEHKFQALSLGNKGAGEVTLKSNSLNGASNESDVAIKLDKAGVKSGYVLIKSAPINPDTSCLPSQVGKIVQQQEDSSVLTASVLVCTYDPDFCGGTGYCLSPLKSQSVAITNPTPLSSSACPYGTRIGDMPSISNGGLTNAPTCSSSYAGQALTSGVNGTQEGLKDGKKIYGIMSNCIYSGGARLPISNIKKVFCVSAAQSKLYYGCKGNSDGSVSCE